MFEVSFVQVIIKINIVASYYFFKIKWNCEVRAGKNLNLCSLILIYYEREIIEKHGWYMTI